MDELLNLTKLSGRATNKVCKEVDVYRREKLLEASARDQISRWLEGHFAILSIKWISYPWHSLQRGVWEAPPKSTGLTEY